jgi:hypothetical protein
MGRLGQLLPLAVFLLAPGQSFAETQTTRELLAKCRAGEEGPYFCYGFIAGIVGLERNLQEDTGRCYLFDATRRPDTAAIAAEIVFWLESPENARFLGISPQLAIPYAMSQISPCHL